MDRINWQDVPLRAINFSSFWLANFAKGFHSVTELTYLSNKNKYKITQEKLLNILDELVGGGLVDFRLENDTFLFYLLEPETKAMIADFKKNNLTL